VKAVSEVIYFNGAKVGNVTTNNDHFCQRTLPFVKEPFLFDDELNVWCLLLHNRETFWVVFSNLFEKSEQKDLDFFPLFRLFFHYNNHFCLSTPSFCDDEVTCLVSFVAH
jgi:hypothetical protein